MTQSPPNEASQAAKCPFQAQRFGRILVALDASDHANRALDEALRLSVISKGEITGIHAYAAKLHDKRFRQMEGGLPERYQVEKEIKHQRAVHDDLIGHGLGVISDSYHDVAEDLCQKVERPYHRLSPEGKNYRRIVEAADPARFDLLALGALGLGAQPNASVGTVCERVVRRAKVNVLVMRNPKQAIGEGPVVVCLDGSPQSFGALMCGFELAKNLGVELHTVAAYDPFYHYVAFNKISGVLSEEAGKTFRFKEQEQLHEELIDEGIAKIYQAHLAVAGKIAKEAGLPLTTKLLEGKPYRAILKYLDEVKASLVMVGRVGVHMDADLDIGGTSENLLRTAPCHIWLGVDEYVPSFDKVAEETLVWSEEAEAMLARAPEFARGMARKAIMRHAEEQGLTYITTDEVSEVAARLMPKRSETSRCPVAYHPLSWSVEAEALLAGIEDSQVAAIRLRADKQARRLGAELVEVKHVTPFLDDQGELPAAAPFWPAALLVELNRVPEAVRAVTKARVEALATARGAAEITRQILDDAFAEAREQMLAAMKDGGHKQIIEDGE